MHTNVHAIMLIDVLLFGQSGLETTFSAIDLDLKSIHQKIVLIEVLHRSYILLLCMLRRYDTILLHYNTLIHILRLTYYDYYYSLL